MALKCRDGVSEYIISRQHSDSRHALLWLASRADRQVERHTSCRELLIFGTSANRNRHGTLLERLGKAVIDKQTRQ
jgi:hypothetical protein